MMLDRPKVNSPIELDMSRTATGPVATLVIVVATAILFFFDRRRRKRGERLNQSGRCARCGAVLVEPAPRIPIAGGPFAVWKGRVCFRCHAFVTLQERIVWSLIAAGVVAALVLVWWSAHI